MVKILSFIFLFALLEVSSCNKFECPSPYNVDTPAFLLDEDIENPLNFDNIIFKSGRKFKYRYKALNKKDEELKYYVKFNLDCMTNKDIRCDDWAIMHENKIPKEGIGCYFPIDYVILTVFKTKGNTSLSNSQTIIKYEYFNNKHGRLFSGEKTGVVEDSLSIFLHPPRMFSFVLTELNPFPRIEHPLALGKSWVGSISIPSDFVKKMKLDHDRSISFDASYEVKDLLNIDVLYKKNVICHLIEAKNDGEIGTTFAKFYFNSQDGFIKIEYVNLDSTKLTLELENIIDDFDTKQRK